MEAHPPSSVIVQTSSTRYTVFNAGAAAIQVTTAVQSAPLWIIELRAMATTTLACAVAIIAVGAYTMASVDSSIWLLPTVQTGLMMLVLGWLLAAWRLTRQLLLVMLYGTLGALLGMMCIVFWWAAFTNDVYKNAAGLWWTLAALAGLELLAIFGAAIALASLLSCRYIYDGHNTTRSAIMRLTERELVRGTDDLDPAMSRITSGAVAIHDAAKMATSDQKKNI